MNILLINHYAGGPAWGMEYRPYYLSREWVRAGHRVRIVAASYSHVRARQPEGVGVERLEEVDGIEYQWLQAPAYRGNGPGRLVNIATFLARLGRRAKALTDTWRPDVVIASSTYPMDFWLARRIARRAGARLVFEVHDLWPLSPIELSGMSPWHPFALLCQKAENDAYRDADTVVSMLPKVHDHMASHGLDLQRLAIVPNGVDLGEWQATEPAPLRDDVAQALAAARARGDVVVGYAGSMGLPNALDTLLDAAALLSSAQAEPSFSFVLVGDGHEREHLLRRARQLGLAHVQFLPPIPKAQVPAFLKAVDLAYIGWQRVPIYRFGIAPNKLMDYMMAGCTVLHSVEAGNDAVAEAGCGLTVPPEAPEAVAEGLRKLAALPPQTRAEMGRRGQAFVREHHAYEVLARRFLAACPPLTR